jgi:UDP-N-acetyl-D-mannosaminuronate dehydrogenase
VGHDLLSGADCVVIVTEYWTVDCEAVAENAELVVDTRGVLHTLGLKSRLEELG